VSEPERGIPNAEYEALFASDLKVTSFRDSTVVDLTVDKVARKSAARSTYVIEFADGEELIMEFA
jgi:hypothetical protein